MQQLPFRSPSHAQSSPSFLSCKPFLAHFKDLFARWGGSTSMCVARIFPFDDTSSLKHSFVKTRTTSLNGVALLLRSNVRRVGTCTWNENKLKVHARVACVDERGKREDNARWVCEFVSSCSITSRTNKYGVSERLMCVCMCVCVCVCVCALTRCFFNIRTNFFHIVTLVRAESS